MEETIRHESLALGSDHAGYALKSRLMNYLQPDGIEIEDFGTDSTDSVDYPDFAHAVAEAVASGKHPAGILICGSGNGVCMTANRHQGIRAALCWTEELAMMARQHNDANVLCLPARYISEEEAKKIVRAFLATDFEGGRHQRRVEKIEAE